MEVEVETKQGYLYSGKLALLDAHYNVQLHESLVRRARAFDFERAIAEEQRRQEARLLAISLQGGAFSDPRDGGVTGGTPASQLIDWLPRPRYIGTVSLRSNNVVLMRFVDPTAGPVPATATTTETAWVRLRKSFAAMAAAIKAHLQREKMRRRAARRRRLDAKKKL
jgi:small nuclear ribonucleoprotein (snRNP)-like protein